MQVFKVFLLGLVLVGVGCALNAKTKFQTQCEQYGFALSSAEYSVCVERETKKMSDFLDMKAAEAEEKHRSFYRDLERKRLGLDVK